MEVSKTGVGVSNWGKYGIDAMHLVAAFHQLLDEDFVVVEDDLADVRLGTYYSEDQQEAL